MPLLVEAAAEADIAEAMDWYEHQRPGLGIDFLREVGAAIRALQPPGPECRPALGVSAELGVRRKLVRRFPYLIIFLEADGAVRVIAVPHARGRPGFWRGRI